MDRKAFMKQCAGNCLKLMIAPVVLQGCSGTRYLSASIEDSDMIVPVSAFANNDGSAFRSYVVVENEVLQFPICIYRFSQDDYKALWMQCTHQGNELQVFGDMLQCPAHGSEFTRTGTVQNGPAYMSLRTFPVTIIDDKLKISLK
jgi:nitrite reductase/ring-hydroxylating ferredoxin subunit